MTDLADSAVASPDESTALSTAPAPPQQPVRGIARTARYGWRRLTSMRTALLLLSLLALAAIPGTVLPQRGLNPVKVDDFLASHPHLGPLLDRLSLFDVFAAPWFAAIYLLLFISLIGCLVPRIRLHARALRRRPPHAPRNLLRLSISQQWTTDDTARDVAERCGRLLRGERWRVDVHDEPDGAVTVAAEKGYLRETGNLVFHVSLVVLLAGIALGGLFGYKGTVLVVQGQAFANVRSSYDIFQPSRLYSDSSLSPFSFTLQKFTAAYQPDGTPRSFDARVGYQSRPGAPVTTSDVQVNHPLYAAGANVYLVGHGYALHIQVRDAHGRLVYDRDTPFLPDTSMFASHGVVKVPDGLPHQFGLTGFFYPTYVATPAGPDSAYPAPRDPVLLLAAWRGDLGLDRSAQSVYSLPVASLHHIANAQLSPGESWRLADGTRVSFVGVDQWATFQVAHDPGKKLMLAAAVFIVAGLMLSLRIRRRRFWIRARPAPDARRTVVEAAGLARSDSERFTADFADLVQRFGAPTATEED
ncbi:MAG TPA: cytochrome c biogenesis protein ResB [Mycobacteriales bacterium]|jgi:cytochrome c biogenesis protein|nr:cytochrome c biogenesis protein ResB [Mycobacteriales bacterium]